MLSPAPTVSIYTTKFINVTLARPQFHFYPQGRLGNGHAPGKPYSLALP